MESGKTVLMNVFTEQLWICRHTEHTYGQGQGRGRGGWVNGQSSMKTYTLIYVK